MPLTNFERMIQLADEVFDARHDPDQLNINEAVLERLRRIHPAAVSEYDNGHGPVAWLLLIPTTADLMNKFLDNRISEKELFDTTPLDTPYDGLYLCSAMVLEEFRRKGIMKQLALQAFASIRNDHPLQSLFVWSFSEEGLLSAEAFAQEVSLPLYRRRESGN